MGEPDSRHFKFCRFFFIAVVILRRHRKSVSRHTILLLLSWTLTDLVTLSRVMMILPLLLMELDIRGYCSNSPLILQMFLKYIMPFSNSTRFRNYKLSVKYSHLLVTYGIYLIMYLTVYWFLGAIRIALGGAATGVFSNSSTLWQQLHQAGAVTGDRVWRFPLWDHFTKRMTGTVYLI